MKNFEFSQTSDQTETFYQPSKHKRNKTPLSGWQIHKKIKISRARASAKNNMIFWMEESTLKERETRNKQNDKIENERKKSLWWMNNELTPHEQSTVIWYMKKTEGQLRKHIYAKKIKWATTHKLQQQYMMLIPKDPRLTILCHIKRIYELIPPFSWDKIFNEKKKKTIYILFNPRATSFYIGSTQNPKKKTP